MKKHPWVSAAWAFIQRKDRYGVRMSVYTVRGAIFWGAIGLAGTFLFRVSLILGISLDLVALWGIVMQVLLLLYKETDTAIGRWFGRKFKKDEQKRAKREGIVQHYHDSGKVLEPFVNLFNEIVTEQRQKEAEKKNLRKITIETVDQMSGDQFEKFLKELFERMGYSANVTKYSGDQGADLLVTMVGRRVAVQAKRWSGSVGNRAVQEIFTAKTIYNCHDAMIITNNQFTKSAVEAAKRTGVKLVNRKGLQKWLKEYDIYT